jgi:hypothetical protein
MPAAQLFVTFTLQPPFRGSVNVPWRGERLTRKLADDITGLQPSQKGCVREHVAWVLPGNHPIIDLSAGGVPPEGLDDTSSNTPDPRNRLTLFRNLGYAAEVGREGINFTFLEISGTKTIPDILTDLRATWPQPDFDIIVQI